MSPAQRWARCPGCTPPSCLRGGSCLMHKPEKSSTGVSERVMFSVHLTRAGFSSQTRETDHQAFQVPLDALHLRSTLHVNTKAEERSAKKRSWI
eukprot:2701934-Rhodomonas_salina.1